MAQLADPGQLNEPRCWTMSLDLTNLENARCRIASPFNPTDNVDATLAGRLGAGGFTVIQGCCEWGRRVGQGVG